MAVIKRIKAPTPPFFKKIRTAGLAMAAVSTVILSAPLSLPPLILKVAGYVAVAGGVASAISQVTTANEAKK
jgi:hypothetical protein